MSVHERKNKNPSFNHLFCVYKIDRLTDPVCVISSEEKHEKAHSSDAETLIARR